MATYDERISGAKNVSFKEAVANIKDELQSQLVRIYFKDEPGFVSIIDDDEAYGKIFDAYLDSDEYRETYALHCRRRYVVRFCGVLYKYSTSYPARIANRVAIELGVQHVSYYLKRAEEYTLTKLQRLKFYNKALKMEMMMLQEDLDWNDDLNDDMFNEIQRFERGVERERAENEHLTLKGKARKSEIELLNFRLLDEFGIPPPKKDKPKKRKSKSHSGKKKPKEMVRKQKKEDKKDEEEEEEEEKEEEHEGKSKKSEQKRGFTVA